MMKRNITFISTMCMLLIFTASNAQNVLTSQISQYIRPVKAEVGVAIIIDSKDTIVINNDIKYPLLSVFKAHQALMVMDFLRNHKLPLDKMIRITKSDLNPNTYSPMNELFPNGTTMPISQLVKFSLQESDNNACDKLFCIVGGTKSMNKYIKEIGLCNTVITYNEKQMQKDMNRVYDNNSTALDAAKLFEIIFFSNKLPDDVYTDFLRETMKGCKTGMNRIPKMLNSESVVIAHKTGTGPKNSDGLIMATNDVGTVWMNNSRHFSIAVFVKDSKEDAEKNESIIAEISRMVYDYLK